MAAILIATFVGDVTELTAAYDRAHAIIGGWESAEHIRQRWSSDEMRGLLARVGFPTERRRVSVLDLHAIEPPL